MLWFYCLVWCASTFIHTWIGWARKMELSCLCKDKSLSRNSTTKIKVSEFKTIVFGRGCHHDELSHGLRVKDLWFDAGSWFVLLMSLGLDKLSYAYSTCSFRALTHAFGLLKSSMGQTLTQLLPNRFCVTLYCLFVIDILPPWICFFTEHEQATIINLDFSMLTWSINGSTGSWMIMDDHGSYFGIVNEWLTTSTIQKITAQCVAQVAGRGSSVEPWQGAGDDG